MAKRNIAADMEREGREHALPRGTQDRWSPGRWAIALANLMLASCGHFDLDQAAGDAPAKIVQRARPVSTTTDTTLSVMLQEPTTQGDLLILVGADTRTRILPEYLTGGGVQWKPASVSAAQSSIEIWYGVVTQPSPTLLVTLDTRQPPGSRPFSLRMELTEWSGLAVDQDPLVDAANADADDDSDEEDTMTTASAKQIRTNSKDLIVLAVSALSSARLPTSFGDPTDGPWTSINEVDATTAVQKSWYRVVRTSDLEPTVTVTVAPEAGTIWAAAIAAFKVAP